MQKGFEQTEFFFSPSSLVPFGLGPFQGATPGVLKDPLLDLSLNPAHLRLDSVGQNLFLYTDFRAAKNVEKKDGYAVPVYSMMDGIRSSSFAPYPYIYLENRRQLEPVFSGAIIGRPLPGVLPELVIGGTYQMVLQDEDYYGVPQDIYRSIMGADYSGRSVAAAEGGIPIVDRESGQDNMHQNGHFASLFVRYAPIEDVQVGLKLGRVLFERNGSHGRLNRWDATYDVSTTSLWSTLEARDQSYAHSEIAGGVLVRLSPRTTVGVTASHLMGNVGQALTGLDSSYYRYGSTPSTSYYMGSARKLQEWRGDGTTTGLGIELRSQLSNRTTLTIFYRPRWSTTTLRTAAMVSDTSYSEYSWTSDEGPVDAYSRSRFMDLRAGGGEDASRSDLLLASVTWDINDRTTLSLGAQYETSTRTITTSESVRMNGSSAYWNTRLTNPYSWLYANTEAKDLRWTFSTKRWNFRIPVFVTIKATEAAGILLGLCRDMSRWEIDESTLALFSYRSVNANGTIDERRDFGERYTVPREETTDITTTFMAGVTVTPSALFQARLLMVPVFSQGIDGQRFEQLQWWLGLTVTP